MAEPPLGEEREFEPEFGYEVDYEPAFRLIPLAEARRNFLRRGQILAPHHQRFLPSHDGRVWAAAFEAALAIPPGPARDEAIRAVGERYYREKRTGWPPKGNWRWPAAL
ncbi:MAG: hypothetical protein U1F37_10655 [Alphaproteobacteria bacterium]